MRHTVIVYFGFGHPLAMKDRSSKRTREHAERRERANFTEYVMYLQDRRHLLINNFLAGIMRGMGFAIGFSILSALVVMLVQRLALENLPVIGEFFAEMVRMVQINLH